MLNEERYFTARYHDGGAEIDHRQGEGGERIDRPLDFLALLVVVN